MNSRHNIANGNKPQIEIGVSPYVERLSIPKDPTVRLAYKGALSLRTKDLSLLSNTGNHGVDLYVLGDLSSSVNKEIDPTDPDVTILSTIKQGVFSLFNKLPKNCRAGFGWFNHQFHHMVNVADCTDQQKRRVEDRLQMEPKFNKTGNGYTHISEALRGAAEILERYRTPGRQLAIIVVSDGNQVAYDPSSILEDPVAVADELRGNGFEIYAIGVGTQFDSDGQKMLFGLGNGSNYAYLPRPQDVDNTLEFIADLFSNVEVTDLRLRFIKNAQIFPNANSLTLVHMNLIWRDKTEVFVQGDVGRGLLSLIGLGSHERREGYIEFNYEMPFHYTLERELCLGMLELVSGDGANARVLAECDITVTPSEKLGTANIRVAALMNINAIKLGDIRLGLAQDHELAALQEQRSQFVSKTAALPINDSAFDAIVASQEAIAGSNDPRQAARNLTTTLPSN